MGIMGHGYGSEFHLLRYLGYHRRDLNRAIERETGGRVLDWRDFGFHPRGKFPHLDAEWKGLEFLGPDAADVKSAWTEFFPQTGNVPNWDAIGLLQLESNTEFLLVEAKAHAEEIKNGCRAKERGGRPMIREALSKTIEAMRSKANPESWLGQYYQYANRMATLYFLTQHNIPSRLIFIYFVGEDSTLYKDPMHCPKDRQEWDDCLSKMYKHLGIAGASELERRVHQLFLPVCGRTGGSPQ